MVASGQTRRTVHSPISTACQFVGLVNGLVSQNTEMKPSLRFLHNRALLKQAGFTLLELLVVIAIVGILAALGAPSLVEMLRNNRLQAAQSALQQSLNLARSEATKRGSDALVSIAANTTSDVGSNGWTVFTGLPADVSAAVAPTDGTRLEVVPAFTAGSISFGQTGGLTYFTYNGQGRVVTNTGATGARSFWFVESTSKKYCVIVNITGRVRTSTVVNTSSATDCV